jgi:hypothetical protein
MKNTKFNVQKKIMASASMLLVSAVMLSSATYAWFSLNKTVTVDGIQLSAVSDNVFLQIKNSAGASSNQAKTSATAVSTAAQLYPVDYTAIAAANGEVSWGKTTSNDPTNANYTAKASLIAIDNADLDDYVWSDTFSFWIAENAGNTTGANLKLTGVTASLATDSTDNDISESLRVLVVGSDGAMTWYNTGASENGTALSGGISVVNYKSSATAPTGIITAVPNAEANAVTATVYVYYCGNDDSVTTANAQDLDGLDVQLTFAVD